MKSGLRVKSHSDHQLPTSPRVLFLIVPSSTPQPRLYIANWFASSQWRVLKMLCSFRLLVSLFVSIGPEESHSGCGHLHSLSLLRAWATSFDMHLYSRTRLLVMKDDLFDIELRLGVLRSHSGKKAPTAFNVYTCEY